MCEWGDNTDLRVPIPAHLSHTGKFHWTVKPIDACIADIIKALNDAGIHTAGCCCGHNKNTGYIVLHDERVIVLPLENRKWDYLKIPLERGIEPE